MALSALLMWRHAAFWRSVQQDRLEREDRDYFHAQFRRRLRTSAMIGLIGLLLIASPWVATPLAMALYLIGLLLLLCWILCMALFDVLSTHEYWREHRKRQLSERRKMEAEVRRLRRQYGSEGNGKHER